MDVSSLLRTLLTGPATFATCALLHRRGSGVRAHDAIGNLIRLALQRVVRLTDSQLRPQAATAKQSLHGAISRTLLQIQQRVLSLGGCSTPAASGIPLAFASSLLR